MPHRKQDRHEHRAKIPDYADAQRYCNLSYPVNKSPSINTDTFVKFGHRPLYGSSRRYTSATEFSYPDSYEDLYTGNTRSQSPEYQSRRPLTAVDVDSTEEQHYYNAHYANSAPHYYSNEQPTKGTYFEGHFPSGRGSLYDYDKLIERNQLKSRPSKGGNPMWSRKSWFDRTYTQPALQQQTAQMHRRSRSPYDEPSRSEMHRQPKLRPTHETPQQIYSSFEDIRGPIYTLARKIYGEGMFLVLKMQPFKLEGEQMSWAGLYGGRWEIKEFIEMDESDQYWLGAGGRGKNDLDAVNNLFENLKKMR